MKRTGTTSWFHRDIPRARRPYTSTTWARQKKMQFVIGSQRLWFDNNNKATKKLTIIHTALTIPKEKRWYTRLQRDKGRALTHYPLIHSLSWSTDTYLSVQQTIRAAQCPFQWTRGSELAAAASGVRTRAAHLPQPTQTFLPSLRDSNVVFSISTAHCTHWIRKYEPHHFSTIDLFCWLSFKEKHNSSDILSILKRTSTRHLTAPNPQSVLKFMLKSYFRNSEAQITFVLQRLLQYSNFQEAGTSYNLT